MSLTMSSAVLQELGAPPPGSSADALPVWPSSSELAAVVAELRRRPPLVSYHDCWALRRRLAAAALGHALVVQGGDCAEMFAEVSDHTTDRKRTQLRELGGALTTATGLPSVLIGRMAGQFAKPRSCAYESGPGGIQLPVYRGDAVNSALPSLEARVADPRRMLTAYDRSASVLRRLASAGGEPVWTSHEAMLAEYEEPLVRHDADTGRAFASSGHLLWAGERTRAASGPQVRSLAGVDNPVAVKLGPAATPAEVAELIDVLDPHRQPGRLALIPRLGASRVADRLPALAAAATAAGAHPVWLCDPMHGNTVKLPDGRKTRAVSDVLTEVRAFVAGLRAAGQRPGGLHLECTPDDVTECVADRADLGVATLPRYESACDPRLNPSQTRRVVAAFANALTSVELLGAAS